MEKIDSFNSPNDNLNEQEIQSLFGNIRPENKIVIGNSTIQKAMELALESNLSFEDIIKFIHAYLYLSTGDNKKAKKIWPLKKKDFEQLDVFSNLKVALLVLVELVQALENANNSR